MRRARKSEFVGACRTARTRSCVRRLAALGAALVLVTLPTAAEAARVCVVWEGAARAALGEELAAAWAIETRPAGLAVPLAHAEAAEGCPGDSVLRVRLPRAPVALFEAPDGTRFEASLADLEPWEAARAVARAAVEHLRAAEERRTAFVVEVPDEVPTPPPPPPPPAVRWGVGAGVFYAIVGAPLQQRMGLEVEGQALLYDDALVVALRAGWTADPALAGEVRWSSWTELALGPEVRWGFELTPAGFPAQLWLRPGLGFEIEWRRVWAWWFATDLAGISHETLSRWGAATVFGLELELAVQRAFRATLGVAGRLYAFTDDVRANEQVVYDAPDAGFTTTLRFAWTF